METEQNMRGVHIIVSAECREKLKSIKIHPRETFRDVIERLIQEHKKVVSPAPISEETEFCSVEATTSTPTGN